MTALTRPVRRTATVNGMPHGLTPQLVIVLYPGGLIGLREHRRRREYTVNAATLYARLVATESERAEADEESAARPRSHGMSDLDQHEHTCVAGCGKTWPCACLNCSGRDRRARTCWACRVAGVPDEPAPTVATVTLREKAK